MIDEPEKEYFTFTKVERSNKALMEQVFRLRYQVYCLECNFLKPEDYPDGIEMDEYDDQSVHFAAMNEDGQVIGTMRLILQGKHIFPVEHHCPGIVIDKTGLPQVSYAEISRLVISKKLRRRKNDELYYEPQIEDVKVTTAENIQFLRRAKPMAFGLYREAYQESKRIGITHWYSLMEKSLWLLLRIHGFVFEPIGEEVDVYGPVRPYIGKITQIEAEVQKKFPKFFEYFMKNLDQEFMPDVS
jgi:N-acyl amino acid synthase of PEP-CTERM/exosortase system